MAAVRYLGFSITWFWAIGRLGLCFSLILSHLVQKCCSAPNYGPKSNSKMAAVRLLVIFENLIFEHWDPLGCRFSISGYRPTQVKHTNHNRKTYKLQINGKNTLKKDMLDAVFQAVCLWQTWVSNFEKLFLTNQVAIYRIVRRYTAVFRLPEYCRSRIWRHVASLTEVDERAERYWLKTGSRAVDRVSWLQMSTHT